MTRPPDDDLIISEAYRTYRTYTGEVRSYCHDVFCVRPAHPAEEEHSDPFGRKYHDGRYGHWLEEDTT